MLVRCSFGAVLDHSRFILQKPECLEWLETDNKQELLSKPWREMKNIMFKWVILTYGSHFSLNYILFKEREKLDQTKTNINRELSLSCHKSRLIRQNKFKLG